MGTKESENKMQKERKLASPSIGSLEEQGQVYKYVVPIPELKKSIAAAIFCCACGLRRPQIKLQG